MQQQWEKQEEQLVEVEIVINQMPDGTRQAAVMVGKPSTSKIPIFDGTGPRELYHKQLEAAAAHDQWNDMEKAVAPTVHLKGTTQQVLVALPQSDTIE